MPAVYEQHIRALATPYHCLFNQLYGFQAAFGANTIQAA